MDEIRNHKKFTFCCNACGGQPCKLDVFVSHEDEIRTPKICPYSGSAHWVVKE